MSLISTYINGKQIHWITRIQWCMIKWHRTIQIQWYLSTYLEPIIHFSKLTWHHVTCNWFGFWHSSSNQVKSKHIGKMLGFGVRKWLSKEVSSHIFSCTINKLNRAIFDWVENEMPPYVDLFWLGMELPLQVSGSDCGLIILIESNWMFEWSKDFFRKALEPDELLGGMSNRNIFRLSGWLGNKFLLF